jgi:hypothetical protein
MKDLALLVSERPSSAALLRGVGWSAMLGRASLD